MVLKVLRTDEGDIRDEKEGPGLGPGNINDVQKSDRESRASKTSEEEGSGEKPEGGGGRAGLKCHGNQEETAFQGVTNCGKCC